MTQMFYGDISGDFMPMFDLPQVNAGGPGSVLRDDYFPYGWVNDYLPRGVYEELQRTFLSPENHSKSTTLGKGKQRILFLIPPVPDFLDSLGAQWKQFLSAVASAEFLARCLALTRELLPLERFSQGPYRDLFNLRHTLGPGDVEMQCEFSNLNRSVYLPPHTDSTDKLLTFVHYYAPSGWDDRWGGSTEVYRPKDRRQELNFSNFFLNQGEVEVLDRCAYRPNRLFFFAKSDRSWHGVSPLSADASLPRHTFNFSLRIKPDCKLRSEMDSLQGAIRESEQTAFA